MIRSLLIIVITLTREKTGGGIALRAVYSADCELEITKDTTRDSLFAFRIVGSTMGVFGVTLKTFDLNVPMIRVTVTLTPREPLLMPPQPWNVYSLQFAVDAVALQFYK